MRRPTDQPITSTAFEDALDAVSGMTEPASIWLPLEPTLPMIIAGARSGRVSRRTARLVYCSMARARQ